MNSTNKTLYDKDNKFEKLFVSQQLISVESLTDLSIILAVRCSRGYNTKIKVVLMHHCISQKCDV